MGVPYGWGELVLDAKAFRDGEVMFIVDVCHCELDERKKAREVEYQLDESLIGNQHVQN